jgi:hypothetical protein
MSEVSTASKPAKAKKSPVCGDTRIIKAFAKKFHIAEDSVFSLIEEIAFSHADQGTVQKSEVLSFLVASLKYDLDPFMREITTLNSYGRNIPVVIIDGWHKIVQRQENFGCVQFNYSTETTVKGDVSDCPTWIECEIYRKDFDKPTVVREYLSAAYRDTQYWNTNSPRMLHHRAFVQCARIAYGLSGLAEVDEVLKAENKITVKPVKSLTTGKKASSQRELTGGMAAAKKDMANIETSANLEKDKTNVHVGVLLSQNKDTGKPLYNPD